MDQAVEKEDVEFEELTLCRNFWKKLKTLDASMRAHVLSYLERKHQKASSAEWNRTVGPDLARQIQEVSPPSQS